MEWRVKWCEDWTSRKEFERVDAQVLSASFPFCFSLSLSLIPISSLAPCRPGGRRKDLVIHHSVISSDDSFLLKKKDHECTLNEIYGSTWSSYSKPVIKEWQPLHLSFSFLFVIFSLFLSLQKWSALMGKRSRGSGGRKIERHRRRRDEAWKKKRMPVIRALHSSLFHPLLFLSLHLSFFLLHPPFFSFFGRLINYANTDHADESSMRGRVRGEESDASKCEFTCCCHDRKKNDGIASEKYQNDSFFSSACYCITFDWKLSGSTWCKITDWKEGKRNEEGKREIEGAGRKTNRPSSMSRTLPHPSCG